MSGFVNNKNMKHSMPENGPACRASRLPGALIMHWVLAVIEKGRILRCPLFREKIIVPLGSAALVFYGKHHRPRQHQREDNAAYACTLNAEMSSRSLAES